MADPTYMPMEDPANPGHTIMVPCSTAAPLLGSPIQVPAHTIRGNNTDATAPILSMSVAEVQEMLGVVGEPGPPGPQGPQGSAGAPGAAGAVWRTGSGVPNNGTGIDGDYYLRTTNGDVYFRTAGSYSVVANIKGITGDTGAQGIQGIQGPAGNDGAAGADGKTVRSGSGVPGAGLGIDGDFYIDTAANTIYGPKTAGAWGNATSIVGPQGSQGIQGIQGVQGNTGAAGTNGVGMMTPVKKTADETRSATTTLTDDSALTFAVAANTKYAFHFLVFADTGATEDFKFAISGPASPTLVRLFKRSVIAGATAFSNIACDKAFGTSTAMAGTGTNGAVVEVNGILHNGANAGSVTFRWAQNTSGATNTTVRAGSFCEYSTI